MQMYLSIRSDACDVSGLRANRHSHTAHTINSIFYFTLHFSLFSRAKCGGLHTVTDTIYEERLSHSNRVESSGERGDGGGSGDAMVIDSRVYKRLYAIVIVTDTVARALFRVGKIVH